MGGNIKISKFFVSFDSPDTYLIDRLIYAFFPNQDERMTSLINKISQWELLVNLYVIVSSAILPI